MTTILIIAAQLALFFSNGTSHALYVPSSSDGMALRMESAHNMASQPEENLLLDLPIPLKDIEPNFIDRYDIWLLDQFGVLHDGTSPLPGAISIVEELMRRKKKVIITSNTSQRAAVGRERFKNLGFPPVTDFVTSGEFCWFHLKNNYKGKRTNERTEAFFKEKKETMASTYTPRSLTPDRLTPSEITGIIRKGGVKVP